MLSTNQIKIIAEFNDDISRMADEIESLRNEMDDKEKEFDAVNQDLSNQIEKLEEKLTDYSAGQST